MTDIDARFQRAAEAAESLPDRPDNDTLLQLYALYKQGSVGDVSGEKPGFFDFVGVAKYEAWEQLRGLAGEEARQRYADLVESLGGEVEG
ncbi:MAG: acyl-CoA-binding protein [Xanthomonadales bacterium]|nr:acyl-CoA-binding protein [Xanthomonadales bacterium]NIX12782.1 acyl-CoA-binding protein [Xanthomonadales bacterium]